INPCGHTKTKCYPSSDEKFKESNPKPRPDEQKIIDEEKTRMNTA
ncbi:hypothetical protein LCGC14_2983630, partial [marine sediment metagenome]